MTQACKEAASSVARVAMETAVVKGADLGHVGLLAEKLQGAAGVAAEGSLMRSEDVTSGFP